VIKPLETFRGSELTAFVAYSATGEGKSCMMTLSFCFSGLEITPAKAGFPESCRMRTFFVFIRLQDLFTDLMPFPSCHPINSIKALKVWYGILGFNVPLNTV